MPKAMSRAILILRGQFIGLVVSIRKVCRSPNGRSLKIIKTKQKKERGREGIEGMMY